MNTAPHHFDLRCIQRGIRSVEPHVLRRAIEAAIEANADNFVERVFDTDETTTAWRFRVAEGTFYAFCGKETGKCITLYTQDMMRRVKGARRLRKKLTGRRKKVPA